MIQFPISIKAWAVVKRWNKFYYQENKIEFKQMLLRVQRVYKQELYKYGARI